MKSKKWVVEESHPRSELLARDTHTHTHTRTYVHLSSSDGYDDLGASKYFSGWDEVVVVPSLFFPLPLSSGESQTPWSHSWRANEVEKIKAAAGDH